MWANAYEEIVDVETGSSPERDAHADGALTPVDMLYAPSVRAFLRKEADVDVGAYALESGHHPLVRTRHVLYWHASVRNMYLQSIRHIEVTTGT